MYDLFYTYLTRSGNSLNESYLDEQGVDVVFEDWLDHETVKTRCEGLSFETLLRERGQAGYKRLIFS